MNGRALAILLLALVSLSSAVSMGEQQTKVFHIGFLRPDAPDFLLDSFREGLHDLGYIEGKNIVIEQRWASGHFDKMPALASELVQMKVDIIVTSDHAWRLGCKTRHQNYSYRYRIQRRPGGKRDRCESCTSGRQYHQPDTHER